MRTSRFPSFGSWFGLLALLCCLSICHRSAAENSGQWVRATDSEGNTIWLAEDREPALFTQNFGDCIGDSLINVTRFDAAYYKDNMTVVFHLSGSTSIKNESLMLYIGVFAYGEQRFELTFNPCNANIYSLCPMNSSVPIEASGIIPVGPADVANIPGIAFTIPDFEGQAILRVFANSTQSQIGCYSAVVTNGATFGHPSAVGSVLGIFAIVAVVASALPAIYGDRIDTTRRHYAHSISVLVVFSVFHHVFFTGALSMNWPSVLVAFWSNYAWSAGMIYTSSMQNSINQLIGSNRGNLSIVGAAGVGQNYENLGGGYQLSDIYRRSMYSDGASGEIDFKTLLKSQIYEGRIAKRELANSSSGYSWYGNPVRPGLPLPGNFSGFAGTLSEENIPASNAFVTGFLWFLILLVFIAAAIPGLKFAIEGLSRINVVKTSRLAYFRSHWVKFTILAVLRTCYIAFFMMAFLTLFQFTFKGPGGVTAIAVIVFLLFLVGMGFLAGYACFYRLRRAKSSWEKFHLGLTSKFGVVPWLALEKENQNGGKHPRKKSLVVSIPWIHVDRDGSDDEDELYQKKFGWLSARFKEKRWWFFGLWLTYELVRACFFGGAAGHAMTQVFGLLAVEFIALIAMVWLRPFEGARLNAIMIYLLGFSKVSTVALSSAFDMRFNLDRITTTVIGIVIIVIQSILTILLMIAVVSGAISSYISITRHRDEFKPRSWTPLRKKYLAHVENLPPERPPTPPPPPPERPKGPYFSVNSVKRVAKIEDEDGDIMSSMTASKSSVGLEKDRSGSRTGSMRSQISYSNLPYGAARPHRVRASWSSADFATWAEGNQIGSAHGSFREGARTRASSRAGAISRSGTVRTETPSELFRERDKLGDAAVKEVD